MKKLALFSVFIFACYVLFAQNKKELIPPDLPIDEDTRLITYKEVINQKGTSQELYDRALTWVKKYYKNTNEVIKKSNRDEGILELRSSVRIYSKQKDGSQAFKNIVYYNFTIQCREGRYRYIITNFNEKSTSASPIEVWFNDEAPHWYPERYDHLRQVDEQIRTIIESLEEGMQPQVEKKDEW